MLTVDLVRCRISKDGRLTLSGRGEKHRPRQLSIASELIAIVSENIDASRDEIIKLMDGVPFAPNERKLLMGLRKVLLDECVFEQEDTLDPEVVRDMVWRAAAQHWRDLGPESVFDRADVLEAAAAKFRCTPALIEETLFADLKSAHRLKSWSKLTDEQIVSRYHSAQAQAVFLKAVSVRLSLTPASSVEVRRLFHLLKFRGLLFRVEASKQEEIQLMIDGPASMFNQTSRYGMKLATLLPRLPQFGSGTALAELSWGTHRRRILYEHEFSREGTGRSSTHVPLVDTLDKLLKNWPEDSTWSVELVIGELVKIGGRALVPDLRCTHKETGRVVLLELMGFWSRDAVWQRVEVAQSLEIPFVFLVSDRLRVSEKALSNESMGALFVFKGVVNRKRLIETLDRFV